MYFGFSDITATKYLKNKIFDLSCYYSLARRCGESQATAKSKQLEIICSAVSFALGATLPLAGVGLWATLDENQKGKRNWKMQILNMRILPRGTDKHPET